jgi:hypothetical protein
MNDANNSHTIPININEEVYVHYLVQMRNTKHTTIAAENKIEYVQLPSYNV